MARSGRMCDVDWRAIIRVVGECRDLGDDTWAWRTHLMAEASRLVGADLGFTGEMEGCRSLRLRDLGVTTWGWQTGFTRPENFNVHLEVTRIDPDYVPFMMNGFRQYADRPAVTFRRTEVMEDADWYRSLDYDLIQRCHGIDHTIVTFRAIATVPDDEHVGLVLSRAQDYRDFDGRERSTVDELMAAIAPLVGRSLARFGEPSPGDLSPRARQVLKCLLEGDGAKQVARRLEIATHTVNDHIKTVYKHFGVESRAELLARWVRRGWGRFSWDDVEP